MSTEEFDAQLAQMAMEFIQALLRLVPPSPERSQVVEQVAKAIASLHRSAKKG